MIGLNFSMNSSPHLFTVKEVAEILKTNCDYVHALRKAGILRFIKIGHYKVRAQELERFLLENEGKDVTDPRNVKEI